MTNCAVVIPIYKVKPSDIEILSLNQCFNVLDKHPIIFVCSKALDTEFYEDFSKTKGKDFVVKRFDDNFFESVADYSKLLLNPEFYQQFLSYEFMLIYQLDAWVFEDKLEFWCEQNYDYIGAPWFEGYDRADAKNSLLPVAGNGGFSLRKISSILKVLNINYKNPKSLATIYNSSSKKNQFIKILNIPVYFLKFIFQKERFLSVWQTTKLYEDIAFVTFAPKAYNRFRIAPPEVALQFSFETQPKRLYEMNNNKLPFGCHAFEKYDFDFWNEFIQI